MYIISQHKCFIGEGPIWNDYEKALYQVNAGKKQILRIDLKDRQTDIFHFDEDISSICLTKSNDYIGVLDKDVRYISMNGELEPFLDANCSVFYGNDSKCGPDGRMYVGTQSSKRLKINDDIDGKLYRIDKDGSVNILLDGLLLSNGMDWNMQENKFYHTDSDTRTIKEYEFDKLSGNIMPTGRSAYLPGVDGFTIDQNDVIWAACWGRGIVAAIDTATMQVCGEISVPTKIPVSCGFCGDDMEHLAITTAGLDRSLDDDPLAGNTFLIKMDTPGRPPYRFG